MTPKQIFILFLLAICKNCISQLPYFGNEIPVTINNYSLDAMEPFISADGNAIFFNSLNDGNTTSLYYAAKVNDSTFNFAGAVPVVNQTVTPRLDAVPSVDTSNNFYWVSTRDYPGNFDNLHRIRFLQVGYTNFGRVYGNIYIYSPGWIIMDAAINYSGNTLIYCNAFFNSCPFGLPCKSALALAQKNNDSTFTKWLNSGSLLSNVNDTANYIIYAPQLSKDELELYYTRALKNIPQTEICVSVRSNANSAFGLPYVLIPMSSTAPEGPTITTDKSKLYYHKKSGGFYKLFLRYKTGMVNIDENADESKIKVFPNPNYGILNIHNAGCSTVYIYNKFGELIKVTSSQTLDLSDLSDGIYNLKIVSEKQILTKKIILRKN